MVEAAAELYATFRSLVDAGYTEEQALKLQISILQNASTANSLDQMFEMFDKLLGGSDDG